MAEVLKPVLRSKGFCWVDSEPLRVNEWSHAGRSLSVLPKAIESLRGHRSRQDWWWSVLKPDQLNFQICPGLIRLDYQIYVQLQGYPGAKGIYERARQDKWQALFSQQSGLVMYRGIVFPVATPRLPQMVRRPKSHSGGGDNEGIRGAPVPRQGSKRLL